MSPVTLSRITPHHLIIHHYHTHFYISKSSLRFKLHPLYRCFIYGTFFWTDCEKEHYYRERSKRYKLSRKCDNKEQNHELCRQRVDGWSINGSGLSALLLPSRQMSNSNQLQMCCCLIISEAVFTLFTSYRAAAHCLMGLWHQWLRTFFCNFDCCVLLGCQLVSGWEGPGHE